MKSLRFRKKLYKKIIGKNKSRISNKERNNIKIVEFYANSLSNLYIRNDTTLLFQKYIPIATRKKILINIGFKNTRK